MKGLPSSTKDLISSTIEGLFDRMAFRLIGYDFRNKKYAVFTSNGQNMGLSQLFMQAIGERYPNQIEQDAMKKLLGTAHDYLDGLKNRTMATVSNEIDSYVIDQQNKGQPVSDLEIQRKLIDGLIKAKSGLNTIAAAETTKIRNVGTAMQISRVAADMGVGDPNISFLTIRDGIRCRECLRVHVLPDKITPRVFKMSQVSSSYHVNGSEYPSLGGLHPHCVTGEMKLHTDKGLFTFKELFDLGTPQIVVVDKRIVNRKFPANQFGIEMPGKTWLNRHAKGTKLLKATHVFDTGKQECLKILLSNGQSMEVSIGHEMWVDDDKNGKVVRADQLSVGDKIPVISGESGFGTDSFEDLAELMGSLMGDGSMVGTSAQWNFFGNDIPYGADLLKKRQNILSESFTPLRIREPDKKYNVKSARFASGKLGKIFVSEFGLSKKPRRVPKRLFSADRKTIVAFLRGLYAADGHSERNPSVVLGQNDYIFLQEIQILLTMFGIKSSIEDHGEACTKLIKYSDGREYLTERKKCWRLIFSGINQCFWFLNEVGFGVPAKQAKLKTILDSVCEDPKKFVWRTSRVEKIEPIGVQQTYCLTEPMTNTITVNGIVTKNCRCSIIVVPPAYGYKNGKLSYISKDYDCYQDQKSKGETI